MKIVISLMMCAYYVPLRAQVESGDSLTAKQLNEVVVEAQMQNTSAVVSTYLPTSLQKNASQSGIELLNRMAIPQLSFGTDMSVRTASNQPVDIFINWLPATNEDMRNMRTTDVKKIEYYDYPSDSRFQGKAHVVNFVMKEYEYGGYLKTTAEERFVANDGQENLFLKFQTKRMTYDLGLGGAYSHSNHNYAESNEIYRLPLHDGSTKEIVRTEEIEAADRRHQLWWPTLRAVYKTSKTTISNTIGAVFDHTPKNYMIGSVRYGHDFGENADFTSAASANQNSFSYSGNWNFVLGNKNSINFTPSYKYSHSRQESLYNEGTTDYCNHAFDDAHVGRIRLQFNHSLGKLGGVNVFWQGLYYHSSTSYAGTANMNDKLTTLRIGPGLGYNLSKKKYYIYLGAGFNYDHSKYAQIKENSTQPWADASLQYSFNNKNRLSIEFHYMTSVPLASYRSQAIVKSNSLFSYTGNPALKPYKSFDYGLSYTFMPNNKFSMSVFSYAWSVRDRYAFVYTPSTSGILRTIEQPLGSYTSLTLGINGRASLLHGKLQISGRLAVPYCHDGYPYNVDRVDINYALQAYYYFGAWNVGAMYTSERNKPGNAVNGLWSKSIQQYNVNIGWGNSTWNVAALISNPFTWSWKESLNKMISSNYGRSQTVYGVNNHCYAKLSVAYVFGFGKQVKRNNEVSRQMGAGTSILE